VLLFIPQVSVVFEAFLSFPPPPRAGVGILLWLLSKIETDTESSMNRRFGVWCIILTIQLPEIKQKAILKTLDDLNRANQ
jgi:hypothetical protein